MPDNLKVTPRYMREDGKYFGILSSEEFAIGQSVGLPFKDNKAGQTLEGKIIECQKTSGGLYSCLIELENPASQRVRDLYCFAKDWTISVGEVRKDQLKMYSNVLFLLGNFYINYKLDAQTPPIPLKGNIVLEDDPGKSGFKYVFWLKLEKELSEEDYQRLKKIDIDDANNYF